MGKYASGKRALDADNQGTSSFISPQTFYGDGV